MTDGQFRTYCNAIRAHMANQPVEIRMPEIRGSLDNVLIAETDKEQFIFKFGNDETVRKNAKISRIYRNVYKIPVPTITAHADNGLFFEKYPLMQGQTLHQAINKQQITPNQIQQIYREILVEFAKMTHVHPIQLNSNPQFKFHNFAREHTARANNETLANIFMLFAYVANMGKSNDTAIIHSDLSPKNTIITDDGHLAGFVDLDSAVICNKNYAFCAMASWYKNLGFDIKELMDYYEEMTGDKLSRSRIQGMVGLNNFGKKMLWQHKQRRK